MLPKGAVVGHQTLEAGSPPVTISGTIISIDASNDLMIGATTNTFSSTPPLLTQSPGRGQALGAQPEDAVIMLGGHPIKGNANAVSFEDFTLSPGDPAMTVDGVAMSLGRDGDLAIGSKSIDLKTMEARQAASTPGITGPQSNTVASSTLATGSSGPRETPSGSKPTVTGDASNLLLNSWHLLGMTFAISSVVMYT